MTTIGPNPGATFALSTTGPLTIDVGAPQSLTSISVNGRVLTLPHLPTGAFAKRTPTRQSWGPTVPLLPEAVRKVGTPVLASQTCSSLHDKHRGLGIGRHRSTTAAPFTLQQGGAHHMRCELRFRKRF